MRKTFSAVAAIILLCSTSGCVPDKRVVLLKQMINTENEISDVLCQVKDEKTAKAWKPKLKYLKERMKALEELIKKEEKPTEPEATAYEEEFKDDINRTNERVAVELARARLNPDAWGVLQDELNTSDLHVDLPQPKGKGLGMENMKPNMGGMGLPDGDPKDKPK